MKEEKDQLVHTRQLLIPDNIDLSNSSNPLDLTKEFVEWMSELPLDFRQNHRFIIDVQGKSVFHDLVKETVEIRKPAYRLEINPLNS